MDNSEYWSPGHRSGAQSDPAISEVIRFVNHYRLYESYKGADESENALLLRHGNWQGKQGCFPADSGDIIRDKLFSFVKLHEPPNRALATVGPSSILAYIPEEF